MKSLFSRFKPAGADDGSGSGSVRGVQRSRSILSRPSLPGRSSPQPSTTSHGRSASISSSVAKELPPRPTTPGPSRAPLAPIPSQPVRAPERESERPPEPPAKDKTRHARQASYGAVSRRMPRTSVSDDRADRAEPPSLTLPELGSGLGGSDWDLRTPQRRLSADNVKKVMFQSPARPSNNVSETDLRARATSGTAKRREPRRASSPTKMQMRSPTPTQPQGHRTVSRSSSRASAQVRQNGSANPGVIAHSPTKSTVARSEMSTASGPSYIDLPESWTAAMDEELIANLGPRERARQEVLWEIVNSEERYVQEILKLNETFCQALLPQNDAPSLHLPDPLALTRTLSPASTISHDQDHLPIAAQYSSRRFSTDSIREDHDAETARMNAFNTLTRGDGPNRPTASRSRPSLQKQESRHSRVTSRSSIGSVVNGPVTLPDDLEQVLTVISTGILDGHLKLVAALRRRYDEQFPLVRSLADVFTSHSSILREYATYILHLERALAQIEEAATMADTITTGPRRSSRRLEETQPGRLAKLLQSLEDLAAQRGEAGLAISLSKPFQRLLKYPLLFQNLLYNTSPSTREYEATLAMVDEVQKIVRSIEDEKTSSEERERAHDAWARIEGIEKNKALMAPKPNRLLVSEEQLPAHRGKSHHRLSDLLKGKNHEQWIVRFSDVSLLCELSGNTTLPIGSGKDAKKDKEERRHSGVRKGHQSLKARNLYKFVKVQEWHERPAKPSAPPPRLSLDHFRRTSLDYRRTLGDVAEGTPPRAKPTTIPMKTEDGSPSKLTPRRRAPSPGTTSPGDDMSEAMSVMSFAFRGDARPARRVVSSPPRSPPRALKPTIASERRMSATIHGAGANAKFANRLRDDGGAVTVRPASRVRRSLPPAMQPTGRSLSALGPGPAGGRVTPTPPPRPPWNASTQPLRETAAPQPAVRARSSVSGPLRQGSRPPSVHTEDKKEERKETASESSARAARGISLPPSSMAQKKRNLGGHI